MAEWEHTEAGWYTHPAHGGVYLEDDGWWHYPHYPLDNYGPYRTAKACIAEIERNPTKEQEE